MTGDIARDAKTLSDLGVRRVTTGYVGVSAYVVFVKQLDDEKIVMTQEAELLENARLVRSGVENAISRNFEIVASVPYNKQLRLDRDIAFVNWRKIAKLISDIEKSETESALRLLIVFRQIMGDDYRYVSEL